MNFCKVCDNMYYMKIKEDETAGALPNHQGARVAARRLPGDAGGLAMAGGENQPALRVATGEPDRGGIAHRAVPVDQDDAGHWLHAPTLVPSPPV